MIVVSGLEEMAENLRLYDAVDGGWEGDPASDKPQTIRENLRHVGEHIAGVIAFKDFFDPGVVRAAIAPDGVQYALRIARWTGIPLSELQPEAEVEYNLAMEIQGRTHLHTVGTAPIASWIAANGILSGNQNHDEGHEDLRAKARAKRVEKLKPAANLLLQASVIQANNGEFDLAQAFDQRLEDLRERFNVPRLTTS